MQEYLRYDGESLEEYIRRLREDLKWEQFGLQYFMESVFLEIAKEIDATKTQDKD